MEDFSYYGSCRCVVVVAVVEAWCPPPLLCPVRRESSAEQIIHLGTTRPRTDGSGRSASRSFCPTLRLLARTSPPNRHP
ncbi:unnamed protein product [Soboliphyme baturini]|uniref:Secreted protein n=1 Tax=Soboliphyme baturini TaxID=241478 RepID=A0A183J922_9BILA|nr:unnamed protein product [Soboliphyme baturini]